LEQSKADVLCGDVAEVDQTRTVNLVELSIALESEATVESRYKRLKRFFSQMTINLADVASWVIALFGLDKCAVYLSIDRTNWKWGKSDINVLMLSIVYKGIALPVVWTLLETQGNSQTDERVVLMQKFINRFGKGRIAGVLGDREFIGGDWFAWLKKEKIAFCIRIKKNPLATNSRGQIVDGNTLFRDLTAGERRILPEVRVM
jgi:hypothetical protein